MMGFFPRSCRNSTLAFSRFLRNASISRSLLFSGCLRGHLRLTAATALLKLAALADNEKEISNSAFETVAYVVQVGTDKFESMTTTELNLKQDLYFQVREAFLIKLRKHLARRRNAPRWNMIPFLSAHDLDEELHELVSLNALTLQSDHEETDGVDFSPGSSFGNRLATRLE